MEHPRWKIEIRQVPKEQNCFNISVKGVTEGAILALRHALKAHAAQGSAIAEDWTGFLERAWANAKEGQKTL